MSRDESSIGADRTPLRHRVTASTATGSMMAGGFLQQNNNIHHHHHHDHDQHRRGDVMHLQPTTRWRRVVREHAVLCCSTRRRREKTAGSLLMIHCRTEAASGQTKEGLNRLRILKVDRGNALKNPGCWRPRGSLLPRSRTWKLGRAPPRKQLVLLAVTGPAAAASSAPALPAGPTRKTSSDKLKLETGSGL